MAIELPTDKCTVELHEKYGGACYYCCETCNYGKHLCHFCGEELRHDETDFLTARENAGKPHVPFCRPDLFPHEPGPLCTWPLSAYNDEADCYWDHDKNQIAEHGDTWKRKG